MNTKRGELPDPQLDFAYRLFVDGQQISIPAYSHQVNYALFRIERDAHIVISNIQYRIINKDLGIFSPTKVHAAIFANPAEPTPEVEWASSSEYSFCQVGERYKDASGKNYLIQRVIYTNFTSNQFSVALMLA